MLDRFTSNILLEEGGERALLTDFGLARAEDDACLTRSGFHPGTPHYYVSRTGSRRSNPRTLRFVQPGLCALRSG